MSQTGAQDTIDLKAIFRKIASKWWLFLITISLALAAGVALIKTTPKSYEVQAVLRMSEGKRTGFGANKEEFLKGSGYLKTESELTDEIAMIKSQSNLTKTLKRLDFGISYYERKNFLTQEEYDYPPFRVKLDSVALQVAGVPIHVQVDTVRKTYRVRATGKNIVLYNVQQEKLMSDFLPVVNIDQTMRIGEPFSAGRLSFTIEFPADRMYERKSDYTFVINSLEGLVRDWGDRTSAEPMSAESNIVVLATSGEVVNKQVNFLNKLMDTYIQDELFKQQNKGRRTISFIDEKIGSVSDSLKSAQQDIQSIRSRGGAFDVNAVANNIMEQRSRLQDERAQWVSKRDYCQQIISKLQNNADGQNVPPPSASGIDDPQLNNLVSEWIRVSTDLATQSITTIKTNPVIIQLQRRKNQLQGSVLAGAEGLVQQAEIRITDINSRLSGLGGQVGNLAYNEAALTTKERDFKLSESLYNYLMEKKYEAGIAIASDQVEESIVDPARQASLKPTAPDKKTVLGGAFLLGLLIPLGFILLRDMFNDRIADADELKRISAIPLLATIPSSKRKRITPDEPKSLLAESFRTARINLQYLNADAKRQVVGMTSSTSAEGKTFCAINLATVMAMSGKRTLLIDADMRRPRTQDYLELPDGPGLSTLLIGECSIDEAIRKSGVQGLDVITAGPIPPNPLELVESPRMAELFSNARGRYDQIIVDASPMGLVSEFKIIIAHVDVTLYIVRQGYTRRGMLRGVNDLFREGKVERIDLILNDVKAGQGYGDGYGYTTK